MIYKKIRTGLKPSIVRTTVKSICLTIGISMLWACQDDEQPIITARIKDALRLDTMGLYYKNFLEAYGLQEFKDKTIARQDKPTTLADTLLYRLLDLEKKHPDSFRIKYGGIDSAWVNDYKPDSSLFIPQILGQLIKLEEEFEKYSLKGEVTQEGVNDLFDEIYRIRKRKGGIDEKEKPFLPSGNVDLIVRGDKERQEDWDDRVDFYRIEPMLDKYFEDDMPNALNLQRIKMNFESVVLIVNKNAIELTDNGDSAVLKTKTLANISLNEYANKKICPSERFANQQSLLVSSRSRGTGFFIQKDVIATNGHVLHNSENQLRFLKNIYIIKGFFLFKKSSKIESMQHRISKIDIFEFDEDRFNKDFKDKEWYVYNALQDWGVLPVKPLSQDYFNEAYISVQNEKAISGENLYSIGHPLSLPKKFIFHGSVLDTLRKFTFYCSLDMYKGNSGSPVIDAKNHMLVGVLSGGYGSSDDEFDTTGDCLKYVFKKIGDTTDTKNIALNTERAYQGQIVQRIDATICNVWTKFCTN